jgi:hypothetical protein
MEGREFMSFLKPAADAGALTPSNPAATGLGRLFGTDGARVSSIADRIGAGMNQIATAGGAQPGYAAPQQAMPNNHFQMLDQDVLRALVERFRPTTGVQYQ